MGCNDDIDLELSDAIRDLRTVNARPRAINHLSAEELLAEIGRLFRALQRLPGCERDASTSLRRSPAYIALETQIRLLSDRYRTIRAGTGTDPRRNIEDRLKIEDSTDPFDPTACG